MESAKNSGRGGKISLYCFLIILAIFSVIAFILTLTKKCQKDGFLDKLTKNYYNLTPSKIYNPNDKGVYKLFAGRPKSDITTTSGNAWCPGCNSCKKIGRAHV